MDSEKNYPVDAKILRDYMFNLPYCEYNKTRKKLVEACMVPNYTFSNWLCGVAKIPALAKQKINEVVGTNIF